MVGVVTGLERIKRRIAVGRDGVSPLSRSGLTAAQASMISTSGGSTQVPRETGKRSAPPGEGRCGGTRQYRKRCKCGRLKEH